MPFLTRTSSDETPGNWFQRTFAAVERGARPYALLSFICLIAFGIGLTTLPPTDRDESRFMQATKQMVETGDYVHIRVQDVPRTKKPIGIYWLQALSVRALDAPLTRAWPYRLPSALGVWIAVLMTCACGRRLFGTRAGLIAGLMMATLPLAIAEAHLAKTDGVLLGLITIAMAMLGDVYVSHALDQPDPRQTQKLAGLWLALGAAMLIKGPVVLLIFGATVLTLCITDHNRTLVRVLKPVWGVPLALAVLAPWLVLLVRHDDTGFIGQAIREDVLPKLVGGQEGHGALPGTYLIVSVLTAWPWSLLIPVALAATWPARSVPTVRFCLAWLVPAWLAFEAIPTKLPHYVLPLMPAAALLVGAAIQDGRRWRGAMTRAAGRGWRAFYVLISVSVGVVLMWGAHIYGVPQSAAVALAGVAAIVAAGLSLAAGRLPPTATAVTSACAAVLFCAVTLGVIAPEARRLWVSQQLAEEVERHASTAPAIALVGFHEPSAVFLLGTATKLTDAPGAAALLLSTPGAVAAVDAPHVAAVTQAVIDGGGTVKDLAYIDGYNYARGAAVTLTLLQSAAP